MSPYDQILQFDTTLRPSQTGFTVASESRAGGRLPLEGSPVLLGSSVAVTQLRAQVRRVAPYFRACLLTGERGCEAEALARALHSLCPSAERPFAVVGASTAELRWARTDGPSPAPNEGLLFLPELDRMSMAAQRGLLRMLRERGPRTPRIVAFGGRGLRVLVSAGTFVPELANLLGAVRIALPALRERAEDIPTLLNYYLRREANNLRMRPVYMGAGFVAGAAKYSWPGNFDQMQEALRWLLMNDPRGAMGSADLGRAIEALSSAQQNATSEVRLVRLEQVVQEHIRAVLMACNGNKLRTAEVLGISRSTLYRMLESNGGFDAGGIDALPMAG